MAYASYRDYLDGYGGNRLGEQEFESYARQAGGYLEVLTYGRCAHAADEQTVQAVAMACCAVAEELYRQEREPPLTAQTVGQWSRSYAAPRCSERCIADAARIYLRGTGLLWRGWKRGVAKDER